jgi:hypothetical protein
MDSHTASLDKNSFESHIQDLLQQLGLRKPSWRHLERSAVASDFNSLELIVA